MAKEYPVIAVIGTEECKKEMEQIQEKLTKQRHIVVPIGMCGKEDLDMRLDKIDLAEELFVVNPAGKIEMNIWTDICYAYLTGKDISSLESMSYREIQEKANDLIYESEMLAQRQLEMVQHNSYMDKDIVSFSYKSYYDDQYEKGQKNVLLLAKAAVYGKLDEVKYENFNAEIGFTLTGDQKEVWKENSKKQQYGLKATENTDFESCMKIGAVPTWTCMNYKSGQYNECLLSVFDANKKVLYVDKGSKCVARAIMRLTKMSDTAVNKTLSFRDVAEDAAMESGSDEKLVIFLERMYFSHLTNAEIIQVRKLLYDLAEAKATALGAKILVAQDYEDIAEEKLLKKTSTNVYISKSKNGDQYLDSLGGDCEKGGYYVKGNFYAPYEQ